MNHLWTVSLAGLPAFLLYFGTAIAVLLVFAFVYTRLTAHDEFALIRQGNATAATALGGSLIGFVLPLCGALIHSISLSDFLIWSAVAFVIQLMTFYAVRLMDAHLSARITRNEISAGIFVASASVAVGLINAACMTP